MSGGGAGNSLTLSTLLVFFPAPTFFVGVQLLRVEFFQHFVIVVGGHHIGLPAQYLI